MKKIISVLLISIFFFAPNLFAQNYEDNESVSNTENTATTQIIENNEDSTIEAKEENIEIINEEVTEDKKENNFLKHVEVVAQFESNLYLSPESKQSNSNIVNFIYPISMGLLWPRNFWIGFQPTISFVPMNFLWYNNMALPAEIENRTSTTLLTFVNLPAVFTFKLPHSKMHLSTGIGLCIRYSFLSIGVNETDPGYNGHTAKQDVDLINKWFWENGHWLYFTVGTSWLYPITQKIQIGPVIDVKLPMGTLIDQHNVQGLMISIGLKLCI